MRVYLSSPQNQLQADYLRGMPALLSFGVVKGQRWLDDYAPSFSHLLIDSGAYSELTGGAKIDLDAYADWAQARPFADAVAALDDIRGDWQRGLENWRRYPWMFPTFHDSDPPEVLDIILSHCPRWLGLGMLPGPGGERANERWLAETLERIPEGVHVHGWALRGYTHYLRLDSVDSTNWFRDSWKLRNSLPWLTPAETLEIVIKRYQREGRKVKATLGQAASAQGGLEL